MVKNTLHQVTFSTEEKLIQNRFSHMGGTVPQADTNIHVKFITSATLHRGLKTLHYQLYYYFGWCLI